MMKYEIVAFYKQEIEEMLKTSGGYMDGGIDVKKYPVAENCFQPAWERIVFFVC